MGSKSSLNCLLRGVSSVVVLKRLRFLFTTNQINILYSKQFKVQNVNKNILFNVDLGCRIKKEGLLREILRVFASCVI